jgi:hypothetical protein
VAAAALLTAGLPFPLLAEPSASVSEEASPQASQSMQLTVRPGLDVQAGSQLMARTPVERPPASGKAAEEAQRRGRSPLYGLATKPGFYTVVEQSTAWAFPATGARWGTGAGNGATFLGLGVTGNVRGNVDTLMVWSLQAGPAFQHEYNVPGNDRTPLRTDAYFSISPGVGNDLNIYAAWRGLFGNDVFGQNRVQNTVRTGVIYSFAKSRIIPDATEQINLPEQGFYGRIEPTWIFGLDGQLTQVQTQAYVGLSETWYPFTFAVEVGPQFVQTRNRNLQTILGSFIDIGYVINNRTRAYVRYRPGLSFGGSGYPAANQLFIAGVNYRL